MATLAGEYNNIMARLRVARDKYYGGFGVGGDVGRGTRMNASDFNNAASWCTQVSARSPLVYSFHTVGAGEKISRGKLDENYNRINAVANCYSNCHSNCHSNCYSDCNCHNDCYSRGAD